MIKKGDDHMRQFLTQCTNNKTNKTMILSEASYNAACFWLYSRGFKEPDNITTDYRNNITTLYYSSPKKAIFYYDEKAGYLMQD